MKKTWHSLKNRVTAMLLALICVLGLLPATALAAGADTIKLERFGMSAGLLAGAAMGMMSPYGRDPMKTQVGKSIHKLGIAVDHAVDNIISDMR